VSGGLSTRRKRRRVNRDRDSLHAWLELTSADCLINIYIVHSTALCVSAVHQTTCDNSRFISIIINIKSQLLCANYSVYLFIQRERDMSVGIYHAKVSIKVPIIIPFPFHLPWTIRIPLLEDGAPLPWTMLTMMMIEQWHATTLSSSSFFGIRNCIIYCVWQIMKAAGDIPRTPSTGPTTVLHN